MVDDDDDLVRWTGLLLQRIDRCLDVVPACFGIGTDYGGNVEECSCHPWAIPVFWRYLMVATHRRKSCQAIVRVRSRATLPLPASSRAKVFSPISPVTIRRPSAKRLSRTELIR